jgi:LysM domain
MDEIEDGDQCFEGSWGDVPTDNVPRGSDRGSTGQSTGDTNFGPPYERTGHAASPQSRDGASTSQADDEHYVTHHVEKADTLAGLAIRYNIAVSDIKRANGLMSEGMMWSRCELCEAHPNSRVFAISEKVPIAVVVM